MGSVRSLLRTVVRGQQHGRVRAIWRILVPVLAGFLALRFTGVAALTFDLNRGEMMVVAFGGTTLVMLGVSGISARYLDHRPLRQYGYRLSREWWQNLIIGTGFGVLIVAVTVVIALSTDSLRVTSTTLVPDVALLGWLLVFFAAFVGVAFYEEFIYRGAFITNAVEGLTARNISRPVATGGALIASTLAFALIHLPGAVLADANVGLVLVKSGLLGGLFGVAYLRTEELALPMGLHLGVNYALMNIFGIGAAGTPGVPSLLTVEHTATGLWSPSRGIPLFVAILAGYVIVLLWTHWRNRDRTARQHDHLTHSRSD
jgi:hypothetical protein